MNPIGFLQTNTLNDTIQSGTVVPLTFTHAIAFGQTGCGKTTSFIYPNLEKRIAHKHGILIYDYKGLEHLSVKALAAQYNRLEDVIEIGKPWGESINLLEGMNEADLDRFFQNALGDNKNNQFWTNGSKSIGHNILKILKNLNEFVLAMEEVEPGFSDKEYIDAGYLYPTRMNLTSLIKVCRSISSLQEFINNLYKLPFTLKKILKTKIKEHLYNGYNMETIKPLYVKLLFIEEKLSNVIREGSNTLKSFAEESNDHLTQQFMGSLVAPLAVLSQNKYFNTPSLNVTKALNEGKIIIINTESLSDSTLASFNDVVLKDLTMRTRQKSKNPISIFIDEAQRILTKSTDLPIDVLREAQVDLILATQNSSLLKNKLGKDKLDALMGNLTSKYYFKNFDEKSLEDNEILHALESFEFLSNTDNFEYKQKNKPLFLTSKEKYSTEYEYQKVFNVLQNFAYPLRRKKVVLEYIPKLFEENKLIVVSIHTSKEAIISINNKKDLHELNKRVNDLFSSVKKQKEKEEIILNEESDDLKEFEEMFST